MQTRQSLFQRCGSCSEPMAPIHSCVAFAWLLEAKKPLSFSSNLPNEVYAGIERNRYLDALLTSSSTGPMERSTRSLRRFRATWRLSWIFDQGHRNNDRLKSCPSRDPARQESRPKPWYAWHESRPFDQPVRYGSTKSENKTPVDIKRTWVKCWNAFRWVLWNRLVRGSVLTSWKVPWNSQR